MLENLTLSQLRALASVSREGSYAGAAKRLGYTSSAVHQQVAALERVLALRLVNRGTSPVQLTRDAESLLPHIDRLLAQMDELRLAVRRIDGRRP